MFSAKSVVQEFQDFLLVTKALVDYVNGPLLKGLMRSGL